MKTLKDKVVAITGAGSGIGRATALELASMGCPLALADMDENNLNETAAQCCRFKIKTIGTVLNVADRNAVYKWAHATQQTFGKVNIIINNAGVSLAGTTEDVDYTDFEWLMNINFWGVVYGTKAFLPYLKQSGEGHIVNVSSLFGIIAFPTSCAYNASKFAVRGFTESLRLQLEIENIPVKATCVCPGGVATNIVHSGRIAINENWGLTDGRLSGEEFKSRARTTPRQAAVDIVNGIRNDRARILIGADAKVFDAVQRILPSHYQGIIARMVKRRFKER
jgi:NADP-dependent 3-hydroxy acid dehydrogenase YdfG